MLSLTLGSALRHRTRTLYRPMTRIFSTGNSDNKSNGGWLSSLGQNFQGSGESP